MKLEKNGEYYDLSTGKATCTFSVSRDKVCWIANIEVPKNERGRGVGTALLREAKVHIEYLGVRVIFAALVSPESVAIHKKVFGTENIETHTTEAGEINGFLACKLVDDIEGPALELYNFMTQKNSVI